MFAGFDLSFVRSDLVIEGDETATYNMLKSNELPFPLCPAAVQQWQCGFDTHVEYR